MQRKNLRDQVWHRTRNVFEIVDDAEHQASVDRHAQKALRDWKNNLVYWKKGMISEIGSIEAGEKIKHPCLKTQELWDKWLGWIHSDQYKVSLFI